MTKYLLVPDVHGREFWREPVTKVLSDDSDMHIIFFGDYVDPYPAENVTTEKALSVFHDILSLKDENPDRITLLLGNHDLHYIKPNIMGRVRYDYKRRYEIQDLMVENHDKFSLCKIVECEDGTRILISHAGVRTSWVEACHKLFGGYDITQFDEYLNARFQECFEEEDDELWDALSYISSYRGGLDSMGSLVWADLLEHVDSDEPYQDFVQIFGHSQLRFPIHWKDKNEFYCIDCHKTFVLDDEHGDVDFYEKDDTSEMIELNKSKL